MKREIFKIIVCFVVFMALILVNIHLKSSIYVKRKPKDPIIMWYSAIDVHLHVGDKTLLCDNGYKTISCRIMSNTPSVKAGAYLFYGSKTVDLPARENTTIFALFHEEGPRKPVQFMYGKVLNLFNYSSTFSVHSDVPFPLLHMRSYNDIISREYFVPTLLKNKVLNHIAPVLYLQSNCNSTTERDAYVKELMKYIRIDSYGKCVNNKVFPLKNLETKGYLSYMNLLYEPAILKFIAKYKFIIAIENGVCNSYITEKFWRSIFIGVVPIYYGAPNIRDWLPNNKSAVIVDDFASPELLSLHLNVLLNNDTKYEEYLEHKVKSRVSNKRLRKELEIRPYQLVLKRVFRELTCKICKRLHNNNNEVKIVDKSHYDCPMPLSVLNQSVNPYNKYVNEVKEIFMEVNHLHKLNEDADSYKYLSSR